MWKTNKGNESGFTFLELMVCFGILMMVVVPICSQFMMGINQRHLANSISEATAYGEKMLEDVKTQMTSDISTVKSMQGNKKIQIESAIKGTANYLSESATKETAELINFFSGRTTEQMKSTYNTDKYSYEVGLWREKDINFALNDFNLTADMINKAAKLYTDSSYKFDSPELTGMTMPINFKPEDTSYLQINKVGSDILDVNRISFEKINQENLSSTDEDDVDIVNSDSKIEVECINVIKTNSGTIEGYVFDITEIAGISATDKLKPSVIELDVRKLMRKINSSGNVEHGIQSRGITFKFINDTDVNQVIELKQNVADGETIEGNNDIFNVVVENKKSGKSTVIKKNDNSSYENYIIGIIIRDKNPVTGSAGKIVKKMVDIYNYDVTLN